MQIIKFTTWLNDTNMYLVVDAGHALLIDPSDKDRITKAVRKYNLILDYILLTHEHYDHIRALNELKDMYEAKVIASSECSNRIQDPRHNMSRYFNVLMELKEGSENWRSRNYKILPYYGKPADIIFYKNKRIKWQKHEIVLTETPGHSPGSIIIEVDGEYLFSGDTVSYDYEIIVEFPGGSRDEYNRMTRPLIKNLKKSLKAFPGHGRNFEIIEIEV